MNGDCLITNGTCGVGIRTYILKCLRQDSNDLNMVAEVDASNCDMQTFIKNLKSDCYIPCEKYEWQKVEGECKPKCSNGKRIVAYVCMETATKKRVSNEFCRKFSKPSDYSESCSTNCYRWREGEWSEVSILFMQFKHISKYFKINSSVQKLVVVDKKLAQLLATTKIKQLQKVIAFKCQNQQLVKNANYLYVT